MELSDYDIRQLDKMYKQLDAYKRGCLSLGSLVGDLAFLMNSFDHVEPTWRNAIFDLISALEEVYAYSLEYGYAALDEMGAVVVEETIEKLEAKLSVSRMS